VPKQGYDVWAPFENNGCGMYVKYHKESEQRAVYQNLADAKVFNPCRELKKTIVQN